MSTANKGVRRRIPKTLHIVSLMYIIQALVLLELFYNTRVKVSHSLIPADIITILLLVIPLIALWSIYHPSCYIRWFSLYGILFNWIIVIGIGPYILKKSEWWVDALSKNNNSDGPLIGGLLTVSFLLFFTFWMLLAFLTLRIIPSTKRYIFE